MKAVPSRVKSGAYAESGEKKAKAQPGDIVEICSLRFNTDTVIVESISNKDIFEEVPAGTRAILVKKGDIGGAVVMVSTGLVGWVFEDEWRLANI